MHEHAEVLRLICLDNPIPDTWQPMKRNLRWSHSRTMSFFEELKRRNVIRVGIAYIVGSWLLVQGADLVFDLIGAPMTGCCVAVAGILALGFIPAIAFAWAFEMTPEGIKKEKDVDRTQSITDHTAKKLDIATMVLLFAAIGLLALDRIVAGAARQGVRVKSSGIHTGSYLGRQ